MPERLIRPAFVAIFWPQGAQEMLFRLICLLGLLAAAAPSWSAVPKGPVVLPPSSSWHVDYAADYCRLARQFGDSGQKTAFYLEQYEPGDTFTVQVSGPDFTGEKMRKPSLRFAPGGAVNQPMNLTSITMPSYGVGIMTTGMPLIPLPEDEAEQARSPRSWRPSDETGAVLRPLDPAIAARIESLELLDGERLVSRLALGSMGPPIKALNTCTDELLNHWGIDVERHRTRTRSAAPINNPGSWLSGDDYPSDLLRKGTQGTVFFRLDVDEKGVPTKCSVQHLRARQNSMKLSAAGSLAGHGSLPPSTQGGRR